MSDEGVKASLIGATLYGVPGVQRAVRIHAARDELRVKVACVGGSEEDAEAVVADADRRFGESVASRYAYDIEDACRDALEDYLTRNLPVTYR